MTTDPTDLNRRTLLKSSAVAGGLVVGIPALSGVAVATCEPRTPGYWANHEWPGEDDGQGGLEEVNEIPGIDFADEDEGRAFLKEPARGDKAMILAKHLIATTLNFQLRDPGEDDCVREPLAELSDLSDTTDYPNTVEGVKAAAENWLEMSAFPDPVRDWIVMDADYPDGEWLKDELDRFNNGRLDLDCEVENCELPGENTTGGGN